MDRYNMNAKGKQVTSPDCALASDIFDKFCNAATLKTILGYHRQLCDVLNLKPNLFPLFYPKLKQYVDTWRAKALWKKFDVRASHKCYSRGKACPNTRVLIVGAGPCGLRTAIEAQLLGAKVVVVEKRDRMSRNNVLHLWPFVIEDLRALGAKKFFGKFCAGAIDHISIRQLQCILLKVALLLGVEIHTEVSFMKLLHPPSKEESEERIGWRGLFNPPDHPVAQYEFDVLIGADGRRNTLDGFKRKEFRGRLAIAITANFINKRTEAEARVEEISGVAFIFNQKFFKDLYEATGIDLENIVYYKDDTHYFVMTAKKQSLLDKGVIINDIADTSKLLGRENVDVDALQSYAREAADFSTLYQMPDLEFAVNHYGNPDVNMFDFTSMYAAENASKVLERNGHKLLMILVGDSLLEPFWPTGSGCARGFLSSMDACWSIRGWGSGTMTALEVLAERESIYRLLGQTTPENLQRDSKAYTLDPSTRYPNLNKASLAPMQVTALYDTDDPNSLQLMITAPPPHPPAHSTAQELHKKRRRKDSQVHPDTLLQWLKRQIVHYEDLHVTDLTTSFKDGLVLCAVIHRYRPDLLDFQALQKDDVAHNNQLAFDILERELGIPPVMTGKEMEQSDVPDLLTMLSYVTQIYDTFRGEIPHIKHPKLNESESEIGAGDLSKGVEKKRLPSGIPKLRSTKLTVTNTRKKDESPIKKDKNKSDAVNFIHSTRSELFVNESSECSDETKHSSTSSQCELSIKGSTNKLHGVPHVPDLKQSTNAISALLPPIKERGDKLNVTRRVSLLESIKESTDEIMNDLLCGPSIIENIDELSVTHDTSESSIKESTDSIKENLSEANLLKFSSAKCTENTKKVFGYNSNTQFGDLDENESINNNEMEFKNDYSKFANLEFEKSERKIDDKFKIVFEKVEKMKRSIKRTLKGNLLVRKDLSEIFSENSGQKKILTAESLMSMYSKTHTGIELTITKPTITKPTISTATIQNLSPKKSSSVTSIVDGVDPPAPKNFGVETGYIHHLRSRSKSETRAKVAYNIHYVRVRSRSHSNNTRTKEILSDFPSTCRSNEFLISSLSDSQSKTNTKDLPELKKADSTRPLANPFVNVTPHVLRTPASTNLSATRALARHKRHIEPPAAFIQSTTDRKTRKRRSVDKVGASLEQPWYTIVAYRTMHIASITFMLMILEYIRNKFPLFEEKYR